MDGPYVLFEIYIQNKFYFKFISENPIQFSSLILLKSYIQIYKCQKKIYSYFLVFDVGIGLQQIYVTNYAPNFIPKCQSFYFKLYKRFSKVIFEYLTPRGFCIPSVHTVFWLFTQGIIAPRLGLGGFRPKGKFICEITIKFSSFKVLFYIL